MGLLDDVKKSHIVLARNEPDLADTLMVAIDAWLTEREQPLDDDETAFMQWRNAQT